MRPVNNFVDVNSVLRDIDATLNSLTRGNQDFNGRRIINAGDAQDGQDYVTLNQVSTLSGIKEILGTTLKDLFATTAKTNVQQVWQALQIFNASATVHGTLAVDNLDVTGTTGGLSKVRELQIFDVTGLGGFWDVQAGVNVAVDTDALRWFDSDNANRVSWVIEAAGVLFEEEQIDLSIIPGGDNTRNLGKATTAWGTEFLYTLNLKVQAAPPSDPPAEFGGIYYIANGQYAFFDEDAVAWITVDFNTSFANLAHTNANNAWTASQIPNADNAVDLGDSSHQWRTLYLKTSLLQGSNTILSSGGNLVAPAAFGCNGKTAQTAYASGGTVSGSATQTTPWGYPSAAEANAIVTILNNVVAALVANGIMS